MKKAHLELIKKMNRDLVLDTIRAEQPISRAKVAAQLGLSRSTVSSIVDELIAKKFVVETGLGSSTKEGGRRAIELGFNPKSGYGVGVEIEAKSLLICIADLDGGVVFQQKTEAEPTFQTIYSYILHCLEQAAVPMEQVIAIGFCIPGLTDSVAGIVVDAPEMSWKNVHFIAEMKRYLEKPLYINNDVNCAALAERWLGATRNVDDFVYISIGMGVGSAIVANGELVQGKDFMAGEIGYFLLEEDLFHKQVNKLGDFGVFDKKISGQALEQYADSVEALFAEYEQGIEQSVRVLHRFANHLSIGIANVVSLLNPEKVIIGGEVARFMAPMLDEIRASVAAITPIRSTIELAEIGEQSGALGAIAYAYDQVRDVML